MDANNALTGYMDNQGRFTRFPGKRQKTNQEEMLKQLSTKFELERKYTEKEVNDILNQHHTFEDPATLRRLMFGKGLINRTLDGRAYWRM